MLNTFKQIGLSLLVMLLAACGAEDAPSQALTPGAQSATEAVGSVMVQKGPVANATVMVKSYEGQDVVKATTNANGQYKVDSNQPGVFIAEARDTAGKAYYSVGQSANMNITHLGDYLLRQWFQARGQDVESVFASGASASSLPNVQELNVLANQIVAIPAYTMQKKPTELFGGQMTPSLAKILQETSIEGNSLIRINLADVNFNGRYNLETPKSKRGVVIFEGSEETSSDNVPLVKGPIAASVSSVNAAGLLSTNSRLLRAVDTPMVGATSGGSNEHWMNDNWVHIKDKKLSELVIPGTHDSGTYLLDSGINVAKTQTTSIGDQLKDGIRYFDLRVKEVEHRGCADPSTMWIYHGTFTSYRLQTVLDELKTFVERPENKKELIILDFQDLKAQDYVKIRPDAYLPDKGGVGVFLGMVQEKLGAYLINNESADWKSKKISELVSAEKRILVLVPNGIFNRAKNNDFDQCSGKKINAGNFYSRGADLLSLYDEDHAAEAADLQRYTLDSQINQKQSRAAGLEDRFKNYKTFASTGSLRVLQIVSRPLNTWYVSAGWPTTSSGYPNDLLTYATTRINGPLNYKNGKAYPDTAFVTWPNTQKFPSTDELPTFEGDYKDYLAASACMEGWLGKRLRMGIEGNSNDWNSPNIIIVDNYEPRRAKAGSEFDWVLPDSVNGRWVKGFSGSYVDMIVELNKIPKGGNRLANVKDMQDGQCLQ